MWAWNNRHLVDNENCIDSPVAYTKTSGSSIRGSSNNLDSNPTLTFKVYSAIGGNVVEFYRYDPRTDRGENQVYIIGKDEDFGKKIAHIADLEILKS